MQENKYQIGQRVRVILPSFVIEGEIVGIYVTKGDNYTIRRTYKIGDTILLEEQISQVIPTPTQNKIERRKYEYNSTGKLKATQ